MNASEVFARIRRLVLGGTTRQFAWRAVLMSAIVTLVVLGACGKSTRTTSPLGSDSSVGDNTGGDGGEGAASGMENEADDDDFEDPVANERAWNLAAAKGSFTPHYMMGETAPSTNPGETVVLVGAGDIANSGSGDSQTAKLVSQIPGTVFTAGDNAYSSGSMSNYNSYYHPTWGRFKARTRPVPGNHEYETSGASSYFKYFGSMAGPSGRGYYSYNIGDWHIIALNSNISMSAGSSQEKWLRADLAANPNMCTLAYWHHPRFSSGKHGSSTKSKDIWQTLYKAGAEIVVVGHDHDYERFAPQTASGQKDLARGIRQFVVGTGGTGLRSMGKIANSEVRNSSTYGVIKFTLAPGSYKWEFVPVSGKTFRDSGSGTCHS